MEWHQARKTRHNVIKNEPQNGIVRAPMSSPRRGMNLSFVDTTSRRIELDAVMASSPVEDILRGMRRVTIDAGTCSVAFVGNAKGGTGT